MAQFPLASAAHREIADNGRIRLGAAMKRAAPPQAVADNGKIRLGAAMKRPCAR